MIVTSFGTRRMLIKQTGMGHLYFSCKFTIAKKKLILKILEK